MFWEDETMLVAIVKFSRKVHDVNIVCCIALIIRDCNTKLLHISGISSCHSPAAYPGGTLALHLNKFKSVDYLNIHLTNNQVRLSPTNTRRWPKVGLLLGQRRRRWANIPPTLGQRLMFAGSYIYFTTKVSRHCNI